MSRSRAIRRPEQQIQRAVVEHLRLRGMPGLVFFHVPNGGRRKPIEAAIFKSMGVRAGVSDLILLHVGKMFALELKAPGGRATEAQMAFQSDFDKAGGFCAMPEGIDAALATLEAWGLIKPAVTMKGILQNVSEAAE